MTELPYGIYEIDTKAIDGIIEITVVLGNVEDFCECFPIDNMTIARTRLVHSYALEYFQSLKTIVSVGEGSLIVTPDCDDPDDIICKRFRYRKDEDVPIGRLLSCTGKPNDDGRYTIHWRWRPPKWYFFAQEKNGSEYVATDPERYMDYLYLYTVLQDCVESSYYESAKLVLKLVESSRKHLRKKKIDKAIESLEGLRLAGEWTAYISLYQSIYDAYPNSDAQLAYWVDKFHSYSSDSDLLFFGLLCHEGEAKSKLFSDAIDFCYKRRKDERKQFIAIDGISSLIRMSRLGFLEGSPAARRANKMRKVFCSSLRKKINTDTDEIVISASISSLCNVFCPSALAIEDNSGELVPFDPEYLDTAEWTTSADIIAHSDAAYISEPFDPDDSATKLFTRLLEFSDSSTISAEQIQQRMEYNEKPELLQLVESQPEFRDALEWDFARTTDRLAMMEVLISALED